jgi:hypothetical protein
MHSCIRGQTDGEWDRKHAFFEMENMRRCLETPILARMQVVSFAATVHKDIATALQHRFCSDAASRDANCS